MKKISLILGLFFIIFVSYAQTSIHYWDFNSGFSTTANAAWTSPIAASTSLNSGNLIFNFTKTEDFAGSTLDAPNFSSTAGFSFCPVDVANNNNFFTLNASTLGYQGITVTYATRGTTTGFSSHIIDYSLDGTAFTNFTTLTGRNNSTFSLQTLNFSSITGANNNANFKVRVTVTGATDAVGNNRFDNIRITGSLASNAISIVAVNNAAEPSANGSFNFNFSAATTVATTFDYTITGTATFTTDYAITLNGSASPSPLTATTGTITVPAGTSTITATVAPVDDALAEEPETIIVTISNPSASYTIGSSSASIFLADNDAAVTLISTIQGTGAAATAGSYTIQGIVTGVYSTLSPAGFYLQEEDADSDGNPNTSEAIFVATSTTTAVGNKVTIVGTVQENGITPSFNQAVINPTVITLLSSANASPTAVDITLPVTATADYEKNEGMIVRIPGTLTVSDNNNLGNFGELKLSANGLVYQPTQLIDPNDATPSGTTSTGASNVAAIDALVISNNLRSILLDDGRAGTISTLPYVNSDNTVRVGSTIDNITAILGFAFNQYRLQPIASATPTFTHAVRPALPSVGIHNVKLVSFNVLNYFNGDGLGAGFPTARGAHSLIEFIRQRDKIITALAQMNGDVVGLIEMENGDGNGPNSAIQNLVNGLNAIMGAGTYSIINDDLNNDLSQDNNTDLIRTAIIYKSSVVSPVGAAMLSANGVFDRPPLAQTFNVTSTNQKFNFIVNHFKSKGGTGTGTDADQLDGQASFNNRRKLQAGELLNFINTIVITNSGTNRIVTVGDYNAYYEEDPIDILRAGGLTVTAPSTSYSYLFNGQVGSLDHALFSSSIVSAITGVAKWNTNSVEPSYLDYNDLVNSGSGDQANPWASTYTISAWRSSDHDAIIIGLLIDQALPISLLHFDALKDNNTAKLHWSTSQEINSKKFDVQRSIDNGNSWVTIATVAAAGNSNTTLQYQMVDTDPSNGTNLYRLKSFDLDNSFSYSNIRKVTFNKEHTITVYPNPASTTLQIRTGAQESFVGLVQMMDMKGQTVLQQSKNGGSLSPIDVSALSRGIYVLRCTDVKGVVHTQKVVIQ